MTAIEQAADTNAADHEPHGRLSDAQRIASGEKLGARSDIGDVAAGK